jgi:hypothetical protein
MADLAPQAAALKAPNDLLLENARLLKARSITHKTKKTPLEALLNENRTVWLAQYLGRRWLSYWASLAGWRSKLEKAQQQSEDCFEWRKGQQNRNAGSQSIFEKQNDSLNLVGAFAEFFAAQAENDLFGSKPWFAGKPRGKADKKLADQLTAYAQWKLDTYESVNVYKEAIKLCADLGTCFTKETWKIDTDKYDTIKTVLVDTRTSKPVLTSNGDLIYDKDVIIDEGELAAEAAAAATEQGGAPPAAAPAEFRRYPQKDPSITLDGTYAYAPFRQPKEDVTFKGVRTYNLDFRDVAFDAMAPCLDLAHTGFYHRFKKSIRQIAKDYNLDAVATARLYNAAAARGDRDVEASRAREWREEAEADFVSADHPDGHGIEDMPLTLVEAYDRIDPTGDGRICNAYFVFCPEIDMVLKCDYLSNVTPKGKLPVFPHTINKIPGRIMGRGYFEKFDLVQTMIDDLFNRINFHDRKASQPIVARDSSQLKQEAEDPNQPFNEEAPIELKASGKIDDYLQFKEYPDLSDRTVQMQQLVVQMIQLRTGITAAQQGELAGLPENNTATGIRQLMSRAAVLLKSPITHLKDGFTKDIKYVVDLLFANFDADEAFLYGEGENQELVTIGMATVADLDMDIELTMVQAQNQAKLEHAQNAVNFLLQYIGLPEPEKASGRELFLQALRALEFTNADTIIRMPVVTLENAIALLPKEMQQEAVAIVQAGIAALTQPQPTKPKGKQPDPVEPERVTETAAPVVT